MWKQMRQETRVRGQVLRAPLSECVDSGVLPGRHPFSIGIFLVVDESGSPGQFAGLAPAAPSRAAATPEVI